MGSRVSVRTSFRTRLAHCFIRTAPRTPIGVVVRDVDSPHLRTSPHHTLRGAEQPTRDEHAVGR